MGDGMYDYCAQPPHFLYVHFICLLSAFYLPLFAIENSYAAGWGEESSLAVEILNGTIVLLQCMFVIGLRLLGQKMAYPYGYDYEDLSVTTYCETTLHICDIIFTTGGSDLVANNYGVEGEGKDDDVTSKGDDPDSDDTDSLTDEQ